MANDTPVTAHRIERILAYMVASAVGLSIICFLAVIIGTGAGLEAADFSAGPWPLIFVLPLIGLPIGLLLLLTLLLTSGIRRGRESRDASK